MMTVKKLLGLSIIVLTAASLSAFPITVTEAAVLKVKPMQLEISDNLQRDIRLLHRVGSSTGSTSFYYRLNLKKGSRIRGLRYQHSGVTAGLAPATAVFLMRVKADVADPGQVFQRIMSAGSTADTGNFNAMIWVDGGFEADAVKRVQKGWTYF
jgi:hypothetical protein